ncbi:ATP-binding protein [Paraburkholderia saeva]|uniref:ATP-binding protein n=1 Tax=Paraburkholderia saeva TaxID=2777537 RepID=UPI002B4B9969|nr:sensor histidine kinase [Paraburkholderia saeva]
MRRAREAHGPGIREDELVRVLDPFYRIANAEGQGSSLGLAIASRSAGRHRVTLSVYNNEDAPGLTVSMTGLQPR